MIIIEDQILLYRKIHVLLLLFFCDVIFKFCIEHPEKIFWSRHCLQVHSQREFYLRVCMIWYQSNYVITLRSFCGHTLGHYVVTPRSHPQNGKELYQVQRSFTNQRLRARLVCCNRSCNIIAIIQKQLYSCLVMFLLRGIIISL